MGCAMDQQLIWQLFTDYLEAAKILGITNSVTAEVGIALPQLAPTRISATGEIMEWSQDFMTSEPGHRHISHLFGFYPGNQFNSSTAPALVAAAKKTLAGRLVDPDGPPTKILWSIMWFSDLYARWGMGDEAFNFLQNWHRTKGIHENMMGAKGYVVTSNYGYTDTVIEMLLQSHTGEIVLLPALPTVWAEGEVRGIVARGGFEISMTWDNGILIDASILSKRGNSCIVRYGARSVSLSLSAGQTENLSAALGLQ